MVRYEGYLNEESPEQLQIEYPEQLQIEYPEQLQIEYPEQLRLEYPEQLRLEYPEQLQIEYPERQPEMAVTEYISPAERFLRETEEVKERIATEDNLRERIHKDYSMLVVGFDAEDVADLAALLFSAGARGGFKGNIVYLGPDIKDIPVSQGSIKIKLGSRGRLPNLGEFDVVVAVPGSISNTRMCLILKKYSKTGTVFIIDVSSLKGCTTFKNSIKEASEPIPEFPGFQVWTKS